MGSYYFSFFAFALWLDARSITIFPLLAAVVLAAWARDQGGTLIVSKALTQASKSA